MRVFRRSLIFIAFHHTHAPISFAQPNQFQIMLLEREDDLATLHGGPWRPSRHRSLAGRREPQRSANPHPGVRSHLPMRSCTPRSAPASRCVEYRHGNIRIWPVAGMARIVPVVVGDRARLIQDGIRQFWAIWGCPEGFAVQFMHEGTAREGALRPGIVGEG